jgi:membrane associated rhomboid family serine protease
VTDGQPEQQPDGGWSERYAETGGWPPPAPGQRRYGPGAPRPDSPSPGSADPGSPGSGPASSPGGTSVGRPPAGWSGGSGGPAYGAGYGPPPEAEPGSAGPSDAPASGAGYRGAGGPGAGAPGYHVPPGWASGPGAGAPGYGEAGVPGWAAGDSRYGRLGAGRPQPQRRAVRRPERAGGGAPVTLAMIGLNVLAFLLQTADPAITDRFGMLPAAVEAGQWERLMTAAFLHAGLLHLATNMLALYIVGVPLERAIGSGRFLTVYLASALGGSLLALALTPPYVLGVGASGAVFGLFGALAVLHRRVGADARSIAVLIGINLVISFAVPNIAWQAHIGGLVTGAVVALLVAGRPPARR